MKSIPAYLVAVLVHACRTSLEELTITPPEGFHEYMNTQREHWDATGPAPMHMQNLRTLTLHILDPYDPLSSVWSHLDDATEILDIASMSNLASLQLKSNPLALLKLFNVSGNPSLTVFEQSIAHFISPQTTVSFTITPLRKNRDTFWTPIVARAFPLLYEKGLLREPGWLSLFVLQAIARSPRDWQSRQKEGLL